MIDFIRRCVLDPLKSTDVLKAVIALVGDLVDCFEGRMAGVLQQPFIAQMLNEGKQHDDMRVIWTWANKVLYFCFICSNVLFLSFCVFFS